jgi:hypothetical protein
VIRLLIVVEDILGELLPLAVAGEGLALQDQDPLWFQLHPNNINGKILLHCYC